MNKIFNDKTVRVFPFLKSVFIIFLFLMCSSLGAQEPLPEENGDGPKSLYWEKVWQYYDKMKESSEDTSENIQGWVKDDIKKIGAWKYKVIKVSTSEVDQLEEKLNELGLLRWECFWVYEQDNELILLFKKAQWSVLKMLPVKDVLKLVPISGEGE